MSTQPYLNGGNVLLIGGLVDKQGIPTPLFQKFLNDLQTRVGTALGELGVLIGSIAATATVQGRAGTIAAALSNITAAGLIRAPSLTGVVPAVNLPAAIPTAQGAVQLPPGAGTNVLGTAALQNVGAFDAAGAAAAAQAAAEAFSANGSNISSGTVPAANLPAISTLSGRIATGQLPASGLSVTITTAKLTTGGTQGSMTFTNGILTAQTQAT